jgi:putative sterol carrier protein
VTAVQAESAGLEGPSTLAGTVQVDVTGGPDGDASVHATFEGGHLTAVRVGPAPGPDATLTLTAPDAAGVAAGTVDPSVVFMRGRMKVTGEMGVVLDLLALASTDAARNCRDRVAARATD